MKKKIIIVLSVIIICFLLTIICGYLYINKSDNNVGIKGNKFNFHTPSFIVRLVNGKPNENSYDDITGERSYTYNNQKIFDEKSTIVYEFNHGTLFSVYTTIPVTKENSESKCGEIYNYMKKVYNNKSGEFYESEPEETDRYTYSFSGNNDGATSMDVEIYCKDEEIFISAFALY